MLSVRRSAALALAAFLVFGASSSAQTPSKNPQASADASSEQRAQNIPQPQSPDDRIAAYTLWLAIFTGALVVVSSLQIFFLLRADKTARISADAARLAAETTRESVTAANREFIATHRPRVRVRRFRVSLIEGFPVVVHCVVANIGVSAAHPRRIEATIMLREPDGEEHLPEVKIGEIDTLIGGQSYPLIMSTEFEYDPIWGNKIEVRGTIEYRDDNGIDRETSFWRVYDAKNLRFHPKDDPDYEYED